MTNEKKLLLKYLLKEYKEQKKSLLKESLDEEGLKDLKNLLGMGFCQQKFYKPTSWKYAVALMNRVVELKLAQPFDYGRGKGKYTTDLDDKEIIRKIATDSKVQEIIKQHMKYVEKLKSKEK